MRHFTSVLYAVFAFALLGCSSVYRQSHERLPPGPCERLEMRIAEARQAKQAAEKATEILLKGRESGISSSDPAGGINFDRAEAAALEFERRVATARDAVSSCPNPAQSLVEIERLEQQSKDLIARVEGVRPSKPQVVR